METSQSAVTAALLQSLFWGSPASFLQARIQKGSKLDRVSATEHILDCLGHTHTFTNTRTLSSLNNCKASQEAVAPPTARREVVAPPPALREAVPLAQPHPTLAAGLAGVSHLLHLQELWGRKGSEGRLKMDFLINLPHLKSSRYSRAF